MNWHGVQRQARQVRAALKQRWAALTDDDLLLLDGEQKVFLGRLQERTGLAADEAERELDAVLSRLDEAHPPSVIHLGCGDTQ